MMADLECKAVSKSFGNLLAVERVSFEVPTGSFFSILGPSGCGKTTLMRMIAGFEEPSEGDIRIKGCSVIDTPANKRNVKMVFQHLALFPICSAGVHPRSKSASVSVRFLSASDCPASGTSRSTSCREGKSSASQSRAAWC